MDGVLVAVSFLASNSWILILAALAVLLYIYSTQPYNLWRELGVPGPKPTPFFGNVAELFDDRVGPRAAVKKWQAQHGRVFGIYEFRQPLLVVTDPEALKQVFVKDFNNFTNRYFLGKGNLQQNIIKKGIFFADGLDWRRMRKIMSPTFSIGKLKLLTPFMNITAGRLAKTLKVHAIEKKPAAAKIVYGAFTLDTICGTAFGLDTNSQENLDAPFISHAKNLMTITKELQVVFAIAGMFPWVGKVLKMLKLGFFKNRDLVFFEENIAALIRDRKSNSSAAGPMDFMQLLMNAEADDDTDGFVGDKKLSTMEIAAQGIIFIIAGYETTATTLQYISYELGRHPDIQERIFSEIQRVLGDEEPNYENCQGLKLMEATINETLRMYPPVHILSRHAENATVLNGVPVPAGTGIYIPIGSIGRDPEFFSDPDTFQPERFLDENAREINQLAFIPFGFGPRQCIGLRLGVLELKVTMVHILRSVKIAGVSPEVLDIEDYTGFLVPRKPILLELEVRE
ncbi:unnamed protein product [Lymnaea stagnalis]|uniref:Cytochrome P450 n=1 Tax=Lymnaea stagnalis TaxID=6523 RepID=A0AAV2H6L8_LYMST